MIGQYLPNNNKIATVAILKKKIASKPAHGNGRRQMLETIDGEPGKCVTVEILACLWKTNTYIVTAGTSLTLTALTDLSLVLTNI
jgi:predicted house-cleaning NTP pyrophosphatase (Maf/HAM1 superfamily)